jgi:hypothetical protein
MKIILKNERPMSWNKLYAGTHWTKRNAEAERVHSLIYLSLSRSQRVPFLEKVNIFITVYFKNRPFDSDNIADKFYIDGLKHANVIQEDDLRYVGMTATRSEVDKNNPRVEIEIIEAI